MAEDKTPAPGENLPVLTLLSDHPIHPPGAEDAITRDMLDLHERLLAPLDILRHPLTRTPFTIALYGDWGTGKTSAMRWLDQQIHLWNQSENRKSDEYPHLTTVWFYPWKYHKREDVWRGIIAEVILESLRIGADAALPARLAKAGKQFGKFLGHSFLHALSNIKFNVGAKDPVGGIEAGFEISGQAFKDIYEEYQQTARPHAPYLNDFETQLSEWVRSIFDDKSRRLVLFIDDLDRCLPEVTLEVLEALKLYLNIPGLLFVAGLDRVVIDQIVTDHYGKSGVSETVALRYLDKIFQVEIDVAPSQTKVSTFLDRKIVQLNEATGSLWTRNLDRPTGQDGHPYKKILEDGVRRLGRHNPRDFTRILNSMLITAHAAATTTAREGDQMKDEAARCLRFAQGAQVYLLRRLLRDYVGTRGENLLRTVDGQEWLQQFSTIRWTFTDAPSPVEFRLNDTKASFGGDQELGGIETYLRELLKEGKDIESADAVFDAIIKYGWDLMLIPFDPAVAAAMPKESVKLSAASSTPSPLAAIPEEILSAIARSLEIPIQELGPQQLLAVERLNLSGDQIRDLTPLQSLTNLQRLDLGGTPVSDLAPLQSLVNLKYLDLVFTQVSDVTPLQSLVNLQVLRLNSTSVSDLTPLHSLSNLKELHLDGTPAEINKAAIRTLRKALPNCTIPAQTFFHSI